MLSLLALMAQISFYILCIVVCLGLTICIYLGVRKSILRELKGDSDAGTG